jgi:hypothetical protein
MRWRPLARRTGDADARRLARGRLVAATGVLDPTTQARASALCMTQLAGLQLEGGVLDEGVHWGRQALAVATNVRSSRLIEYLTQVRIAAREHLEDAAVNELVDELDNRLGPQLPRAIQAAT